MKIIDFYIIKRYIGTFITLIVSFIPIGVMMDMAEKIDKFKEKEIPLGEILAYYVDFIWYFANLLFPIFLFLSVIWFTSKLANDSEVIAILSSGISFSRFLRPYLIAAGLVTVCFFYIGMYVVPESSLGYNKFIHKYISRKEGRRTSDVFQQINDDEFVYVSSYDPIRRRANNFVLERFENNELRTKITARSIRWVEKDSVFRLLNYSIRTLTDKDDIYEEGARKEMFLDFNIDDLTPVTYLAETLNFSELNRFIKKERERGSVLINDHLLVRHKRWSLPVSSFILTIIAVAVASFKRRGGMGVNLAFGITLGFLFIFFDKIFSVMTNKSTFPPALAAWLPLVFFGVLATILLRHAKR